MKRILLTAIVLTLLYNSGIAQCPPGRYLVKSFGVDTIKDVLFGSPIATSGTGNTNLVMDIYQPSGDVLAKRPLVIFAHGGTFIAGDRRTTDMIRICNNLAERGYVCASIEYRLESALALLSTDANEKMVKAVIRAVQDGKSAIRFFRKDAAEGNIYKIDTNQIFFGGTSAGGILAIHLAYMHETDPLPATWLTWANDLGGFEGNSGNPGHSSDVKAIVSYAGAIGNVDWMNEIMIPWVDFHSVDDGTVPDSVGYPLGIINLPLLYGGREMNKKAYGEGYYHEYWPFPGTSHPPFSDGLASTWDTIENKTTYFLYKNIECNPNHILLTINDQYEITNHTINVYPIPSNNELNISSSIEQPLNSISILDIQGKEMISIKNNNTTSKKLDISELENGIYFIRINMADQNYTVKILKQ